MVRTLMFVPAMFCAAAIATAQTPAPRPDANPPAVQQPAPQQPTTQPPASQRPAQPMTDAAGKVTYTGCVKPGTAAGTWVLENAEVARPAGAAGQASSSTPASSTVGTSGIGKTTLSLSTKPGTDLKPHANHKVEIVGSVSPKLTMPGSPSGQPSAGQPDRREFAVESVKMVSATCP